MDWRVQKFLSLIEAHECRDGGRSLLTEAEIAVHLSNSRLRHIFKAETGLAPGQFLKSLRLQKARQLLGSRTLTIKEVMAQSGFTDKSNFSREFKQAFGVSPSAYRSQLFGEELRSADPFPTCFPPLPEQKSQARGSARAAKFTNR